MLLSLNEQCAVLFLRRVGQFTGRDLCCVSENVKLSCGFDMSGNWEKFDCFPYRFLFCVAVMVA